MYEFIAKAIGVVAMAFNILSFQNKNQKNVIAFQLFGGLLFSVSFFMLGAMSGCLLNLIAVIRAVVFVNKQKLNAEHPLWLAAFALAFTTSYVLVFVAFDKEPTVKNLIIEFLPVIGMLLSTISFRCKDAKSIRAFGIFVSPFWLTYNVINFALGGIICEVISIISIIIGMIRFDIKIENKEESR